MRIIAGKYKRRQLLPPSIQSVIRPTADAIRELIFNLLMHNASIAIEDWSSLRVLDAFAGTGALGLEALSRGARHCTFVDSQPAAIHLVQQNIRHLGVHDQTTVYETSVLQLPISTSNTHAQLIFLDPPYHQGLLVPTLEYLYQTGWIQHGTQCVIECGIQERFTWPVFLTIDHQRTQGITQLTFARINIL